MVISCRVLLLCILSTLAIAAPAFAESDHVSVLKDVTVAEGETAGDVVCIFCNVTVRGNVQGDIVSVLGGVKVEGSQWITGDLVAVGGDVALGGTSSVHGDLVVVAGQLTMSPEASVNGDRSVVEGRGWLLLPLLPFVFFIGMVWLIVWLVRRSRYRFPAYPQGRGF